MDYSGGVDLMDCLVGLSPGGGTSAGIGLNLDAGPNPITAGDAAYELFDLGSLFDLSGNMLCWSLDGTGNPTSVDFCAPPPAK